VTDQEIQELEWSRTITKQLGVGVRNLAKDFLEDRSLEKDYPETYHRKCVTEISMRVQSHGNRKEPHVRLIHHIFKKESPDIQRCIKCGLSITVEAMKVATWT
jgi:hypothetical protein